MDDQIRSYRKKLVQVLAPFVGNETGLLHLQAGRAKNEKSEGIPTALNLTYCLFLLRLKERSYMDKALLELKHLLFFQSHFSVYLGNFPTYLHQYPICERQFELVDCLYPIYWILKDFQSILDADLQKQIQQSVFSALESLTQRFSEQRYSYRLTLQVAMLFHVYGEYYKREDWLQLSRSSLDELSQMTGEDLWASPRELSRLVLPCVLMDKHQLVQFKSLIEHFDSFWHGQYEAYKGPAYLEFFDQEKPEVTLYHLLMNYRSQKSLSSSSSLLHTLNAELFLESDLAKSAPKEVVKDEIQVLRSLQCIENKYFSASWINWPSSAWVKTGGVYPLKILFQDRGGALHNFVMQMGTFVHIQAESSNTYILDFVLGEEGELEMEFFWDLASGARVVIEGQPATLFKANQPCRIHFGSLTVTLEILEGFDHLWGQILHKNRKSQLEENPHHSFDKCLYYRSTQEGSKKIKCRLHIDCLQGIEGT